MSAAAPRRPAPLTASAPPRLAPWLALLAAALTLGCDSKQQAPPAPGAPPRTSASAAAGPQAAPGPDEDRSYALPAPPRIVAIGDVHGDLTATRAALRLAGAIDDGDHWTGGDLVVVQTGDELDRGDQEQGIVDLFDRLAEEARAKGGAVHALNGNHEIMNVQGDFRYVTDGGFKDFEDVPGADPASPLVPREVPARSRARAAAFLPGGPYAKKLAARRVIVMVGDTVFAHGGVLPTHARYGVGRINREVQAWMRGEAASPPAIVTAEDSPVWTRRYGGDAPGPDDCEVLDRALAALSAKRMVVGHTVQKRGINPGCGERLWRIDVGMSAFYGGRAEALEITGNAARVLKAATSSDPR